MIVIPLIIKKKKGQFRRSKTEWSDSIEHFFLTDHAF